MPLVSTSIASLKSKALHLPKFLHRDKKEKEKAKREVQDQDQDPAPPGIRAETVEPAPESESAPTLQPFDIPRPVHAKKKGKKGSVSEEEDGSGPVVKRSFDIPRPVHAEAANLAAGTATATATATAMAPVPVLEPAPVLQPFDIPRPVHAKKGNKGAVQTPEPVPAPASAPAPAPTLQPFEIPRPAHAKKSPKDSVPAVELVAALQPFDIPRPVHAKPTQKAAVQASTPALTLQPFDIPRPTHAKKEAGKSPTKKDRLVHPTAPAPVPSPATAQTVQVAAQAATHAPYPSLTDHPLFPPAPNYDLSTVKNRVIWTLRQLLSHLLSGIGIFFILIIYALHSLKNLFARFYRKTPPRPFQQEENRRAELRKIDSVAWTKREIQKNSAFPDIAAAADVEASAGSASRDGYVATEGGPDKFLVDVGYYARRVGLDCEDIKVQTEDGFILDLWHVYDPREYTPLSRAQRMIRGPESIDNIRPPSRAPAVSEKGKEGQEQMQKYPVLMMHGFMQSSGVYCTNDDHSLAFWLCKQGYDVWLGNNRSGFNPEHVEFKKGDPRMWAWNILHMATLDLPALTARVLSETSCPKLGLIAHSQGASQSFIALSKTQRPSFCTKISVLCALAPAAYTGPLRNRMPFKILRLIPISLLDLILGIKSFLPILSLAHSKLQGRIPQSWLGSISYHLSSQLFSWNDSRWDRGLRSRNLLFTPTPTSAEAMKWWLSRDRDGCILSTPDRVKRDVEEDLLQDYFRHAAGRTKISEDFATSLLEKHVREPTAPETWFSDGVADERRTPPMAFWVAGEDGLCDGRELLNRFERGREPGVRVLDGGANVVEGYGHLDVLWACDVLERVGRGVRDALWRTVDEDAREGFRVPRGVEGVEAWVDDRVGDGEQGEMEDTDSESDQERNGVAS